MVHESCESRMDEVLADALIYGNELKGEEKYGIFIQFLDLFDFTSVDFFVRKSNFSAK